MNKEPAKNYLLLFLKYSLALVILILSGTIFFTRDIGLLGYSSLASGLFFLVIGMEEYCKGKKKSAFCVLVGSAFIFIVSLIILSISPK
ncbi:MAG: DUF3953 domain-containing protein [Bacillota bacterium]